jgi:hypothetical protein
VPVPTPPAAMRPATAPSGAMPPMRPASAPMGAPGAPPRPPAQDVAGIASMVSQKGQMELDQAQGPEQIINAFRGNQKPLEARYQELAQYVGPQDAAATPLSVLTMVQPSLMMTAKGASESGIGELMANVAGGVNMESAPGQPNRMGQGLGNLMMSRQAPQPAGMAQGGVVGKFAEGGNPLVEYYKQDLPAFQEILAPSQGDKDAAKRQLFFDIAQRGLAMAGGAGGTGNVASQLANVFQTLPQTYSAQQAELRKGERAAQQAALQSASGRLQVQREQQAKAAESAAEASRRQGEAYQKFIYDMTLANNEAMLEAKNKGEEFEGVSVVDPKGTQLAVLNTLSPTFESDLAKIKTNNPGAQVIKMSDFKDLFSAADGFKALGPNSIEGVSTYAGMLSDGQTLNPQQISDFSQNVTNYLNPRTDYRTNPVTGNMEPFTVQDQLSPFVKNTITKAIEEGRLPPDFMTPVQPGAEPVVPEVTDPVVPEVTTPDPVVLFPVSVVPATSADLTKAEQLGLTIDPDILATAQQTEEDFLQADYSQVLGTQEGIKKILGNAAVNILRAFDGLPLTGTLANALERSEEEYDLSANLTSLNNGLTTQFYATRTGRAAGDERDEFRVLLPQPYKLTEQPKEFVSKYKALLSKFSKAYAEDVSLLNSPLYTNPADTQELLRSIQTNQSAINDLQAIILGAEKSLNRYSNEITGPASSTRGNVEAARRAALGN